jgi:hypothetical protein
MLFAMGTVLGLATISWLTYHYFRDSPILMEIVQKQLLRNIDLEKIKNGVRIRKEIPTKSGAVIPTKSGAVIPVGNSEKKTEEN